MPSRPTEAGDTYSANIKRPRRAISNTIAGLIVFTFILTALVPLLINLLASAQSNIQLAQSIVQKIRSANAPINITLDYTLSSLTKKVYLVTNKDSKEHSFVIFSVKDSNGDTYFVKPGLCVTSACTAGTAQVYVTPISNAVVDGSKLLLHPNGKAKITVVNGELISAVLSSGAYIKPITPPPPSSGQTQYAAVAGSVKTNYFNLTGINDLAQLANNPNIVIGTSPNSSSTNTSIFWKNMVKSLCYVNEKLYEGGFQPADYLNQTSFDAIFIHNLEPIAGSFVIGGGGAPYTPPFKSAALIGMYTYAPYNGSEPAIVAVRDGAEWFAVFVWPNDDQAIIKINSTELSPKLAALEYEVVENAYGKVARLKKGSTENISIKNREAKIIFDTKGFGAYIYIPTGTYYQGHDRYEGGPFIIYCPLSSIANIEQNNDKLLMQMSDCIALGGPDGIENPEYGTALNINISIKNFQGDDSLGYFGRDNNANINASLEYDKDINTYRDSEDYAKPVRIKMRGVTTFLSTHNDATNSNLEGAKAFGFYYYSGDGTYRNIAHAILDYELRDATLTFFNFVSGATSGIEPFTLIADTDGNGLNEIIFIDEGTDWGYRDSYDDLGTHIYTAFDDDTDSLKVGCLEQTINKVYLKFIGPYGINGSQIAQVSIQIRYKFHDNAADDVNDVDDPKQYLMSFQLISPNGTVYMTSDYIYQQLMNIEDTWPPNTQWVTDSVFLLLPNQPNDYYVAFVVNDPYGWSFDYEHDDMDFTLAVEWLGMWYLHR